MKKTITRISSYAILGLALLTTSVFTSCSSDDNSSDSSNELSLDLSKISLEIPTEGGKIWSETFKENTPLITAPYTFSHNVSTFGADKYWRGFTVSNSTDKKDQGSAFNKLMYGTMAETTNNMPFLVAFTEGVSDVLVKGKSIDIKEAYTVVTLEDNYSPVAVELALSSYTYHSTQRGDPGMSKKFEKGDFFKVVVFGLDENKVIINSPVEHYLIDYRNGVVKVDTNWKKVSLKVLGKVKYLVFYVDSSDKGQWGVNTPAYFTVKDLVVSK
ncbi:DUF4465 domain-containing protein [Myroides sp. M-43]|uniref:DUF4465 domain-containing protein n=1 Tax=Myroides oncorhynchi TaxID=2893756 RepID=UPI001E546001|nr:DUF4465 domain-containing protein [Myroides oncorhynchi]MCC9042460.1 DUF4465 domain-containing protein [Myroides oncorhynchi]